MEAANEQMLQDSLRKYELALADKGSTPYAVIQALNNCLQQSQETTIQALYEELKHCSKHLTDSIRASPTLGDRTLLSLSCLIKIYFRMAQKVDFEQGIDDIKSTIHLKGLNLAEHSLQYNSLIRKFSEPHLREGMVSHFDYFIA